MTGSRPSTGKSGASKIGHSGEEQAAGFLIAEGYRIIGQNVKIGSAEIDIIAEKDNIIAFIEVKTTRSLFGIPPLERVTRRKMKLMIQAAESYFFTNNIRDRFMRFDIITIDRQGLTHYTNAFDLNYLENG